MYEKLINFLAERPKEYAPGEPMFWNDPHISKSMLETHLNPDLDLATRKLDFVRRSADWIAKTADPQTHPRLLDLGCGPGIYAELFHARGFEVTGIDISPRSIAYAREHAAAENMDIRYRCQNYLDMDDDQAFDVITLIYCDFGVLSSEERRKLLHKISRALKKGGLFIVDVCAMKQYEGQPETASWSYSNIGFWSERPYACLHSFYRYDCNRIYLNQFVIVEADEIRCYNIWNHGFSLQELENDLSTAGFVHASFFGDVAGGALADDCKTLCAVALKA